MVLRPFCALRVLNHRRFSGHTFLQSSMLAIRSMRASGSTCSQSSTRRMMCALGSSSTQKCACANCLTRTLALRAPEARMCSGCRTPSTLVCSTRLELCRYGADISPLHCTGGMAIFRDRCYGMTSAGTGGIWTITAPAEANDFFFGRTMIEDTTSSHKWFLRGYARLLVASPLASRISMSSVLALNTFQVLQQVFGAPSGGARADARCPQSVCQLS